SGMKVVVVTNQSGVARGFFDETFVRALHEHMDKTFKTKGARIDRFYYCPHHPTEGIGSYRMSCGCRKPEPGMLVQASAELDIDLTASYMVGDAAKDMELANRTGAKGILVRTGYGKDVSSAEIRAAYIAEDILDAARWILEDRNG
ncbi:MAG: HAD-IIIA family hydrolase, partial [Deltaproteobacteria bacterium]|nr:HAD-IIIA family hydrolase [Deltaproteobacteria bacterium]